MFESLMQQALTNGNTDLVEKLFDENINLNAVVIGITNINIRYSGKMRYLVSYIQDKMPDTYFLLVNLTHLQNEKFLSKFSAFINPGGLDSFPEDIQFNLRDLDKNKMLESEYLYQSIINISNKYHIPYLGICSGAQHLILNHGGFLERVEGYKKTHHMVEFIPGTFPYFLALSEQEQFEMLDKCLLPPISFSVYTSHYFSAIPNLLGMNIQLGAITKSGVVEAFSRGAKQIGLQFHIEYGYFKDSRGAPNREKIIIDNFITLVKRDHEIKLAKNMSDAEFTIRMDKADKVLLSRLESCVNIGMSPKMINYNDLWFNQCELGSDKYYEQYKNIINEGFIEDIDILGFLPAKYNY